MAVRFRLNFDAILDTDVAELAGGTLTFYETGTTNLKSIYTTKALGAFASNPYTLDSAGEHGDIWCDNSVTDYRVVIKDSNGAVVPNGDVDPLFGLVGDIATYDLPVYVQGVPTGGEVYPIFNITRALRLPADLTASVFTCGIAPTADCAWTIYKNAVAIGLLTFTALTGAVTVSFANDVDFASGNQFSLQYQSVADATAGAFSFTFVFTLL